MNLKRIIMVLIVACCIEIFGINFFHILNVFDNSVEKNIEYTLQDMQKVNWSQGVPYLISKYDPNLIIENVNVFTKKIKLDISSNQEIPYIQVFYTNNENENFNEKLLVEYEQPVVGEIEISINQYVKDLRIDLGDEEGVILDNINVIINPTDFNFSISRVVAMILIYFLSIGLFYLQKNPEYNVNQLKEGK